jgi:anti-repressor protein
MNKDMIKVEVREGIPVIDARELWRKLESRQKYIDWIKNRLEKYGFIEGKDFFLKLGKSTGGRPSQKYLLFINTAKQLCMVENNDLGRQVREYLISIEEEYRTGKHLSLNLDTELDRALIVMKALQIQQQMIEEMQPKAEAFDRFIATENLHRMDEAARLLEIGKNTLYRTLRFEKIFMLQNNYNMPLQKYMDAGYFKVKETVKAIRGEGVSMPVIYITAKGMDFLRKRLQK